MKKISVYLNAVFLVFFTLLWLSSYTHHSSIGIDHDHQTTQGTLRVYYRLNWTGNGSLWAGYGSTWKTTTKDQDKQIKKTADTLEKFDLAGVLLQPARNKKTPARSVWNQRGFWYINAQQPRPTFWVGIPSGLPVLVLGLIFLVQQRLR